MNKRSEGPWTRSVASGDPGQRLRLALGRLVRLLLMLGSMLVLSTASGQGKGGVRVALIVGNAAYPAWPLSNPVNDANAMAEVLRGFGFTVIDIRDANKAEMQQAIAKAHDLLKGRSGVGMFYYAGHGLQLGWRNYLIPVDARLGAAHDVPRQTVDLQSVLDAFDSAGNAMSIVVLDACRDNPFGSTGRGAGLAPIDARWGTFLAYATAPGNVAEDGPASGGHSLYTQHLVHELKQPNPRIEDVFKRVRLQVRQRTKGRQIPWESTSLEDEFYFDKGLERATSLAGSDKEKAFNEEKAEWDRIRESRDVDDLYAFLKRYPNGSISELAQSRLERLQAALITPQPDREGEVPPANFLERYRVGDRFDFVFTDGLTGAVRNHGTQQVTSIKDDIVEIAGTGMPGTKATSAGFVIRDGSGSFDPPYPLLPGGSLRVGAKYSARSIRTAPSGQKIWVDVDARVAAREKIKVPLGELDTYRIEIRTQQQSGVHGKMTLWFDPTWGSAVKLVTEFRWGQQAPEIVIREMTKRSRGNS